MAAASTLVLVAQDASARIRNAPNARNMLGFAGAWAKQIYTCTGAGCVKPFDSYSDFLNKLKSFTSIGKLGILCHSADGSLTFPVATIANAEELKPLSAITGDLGAGAPAVDQVDFLGCLVGRDPVAMWDFAIAVKADAVNGHSWFHVFQPLNLKIGPGETGASLEEKIGDSFPYLLPNTDLATAAAQTGKSVQLWLEWFRREAIGSPTRLDAVDDAERKKSFKRRSVASPQPIHTRAAAEALKLKYEREPIADFDFVQIGPL